MAEPKKAPQKEEKKTEQPLKETKKEEITPVKTEHIHINDLHHT